MSDIDKFYPEDGEVERPLYCLDEWPDQMKLGGNKRDKEYYRLQLLVTPCNYEHTYLGGPGLIDPECDSDFE